MENLTHIKKLKSTCRRADKLMALPLRFRCPMLIRRPFPIFPATFSKIAPLAGCVGETAQIIGSGTIDEPGRASLIDGRGMLARAVASENFPKVRQPKVRRVLFGSDGRAGSDRTGRSRGIRSPGSLPGRRYLRARPRRCC